LFHNTSLGHANTNNLVQVMLHGVHRVGADSVMPGFAHELTDTQIATLGNYLLTSYGNHEAKVTEPQVVKLRDPATAGADNTLVTLARAGIAAGVIVVLAFMVWLLRRRRTN
jgi:mono/diheme cytochrome c family protein